MGFGVHFNMGNLQYRATVWICRRLSNNLCSEDICHPIDLFQCMIREKHTSWGHYVVDITWLNRHFIPKHEQRVFAHLKKHYAKNMYSFWYLAGQYYVHKICCFVCRSIRTWFLGVCCQICQSAQDSAVSSAEGTATNSKLHAAQAKTPTI